MEEETEDGKEGEETGSEERGSFKGIEARREEALSRANEIIAGKTQEGKGIGREIAEDALLFTFSLAFGPAFDFIIIARKYGMRGYRAYRRKVREARENDD